MSKIVAVLLFAAVGLLCAGSSAAHGQEASVPWYMKGHIQVTTKQGGWQTMPADLKRKFTGRALSTAVDCRKWVSKTFTYWNFWKKAHINIVLWTLTEKVGYCTDGVNVTYFYRNRSWTRPPLPVIDHIFRYNPWSFDGYQPVDYDCSDQHCWDPGNPQPSRMAIVEAQFSAHPCVLNLCNIVYPIVLVVVYGNGQVVAKTGQE
jgi:hypothetical protein